MFHDKVLEIIIYILNELKHQKNFNDIDYSVLTKIGYTDSEINTAIAWISSQIQEDEKYLLKILNLLNPFVFYIRLSKNYLHRMRLAT